MNDTDGPKSVRIAVYVPETVGRMLNEMVAEDYPDRRRAQGLIVEKAIREMYERRQREKETTER